jgi:AsmA protein
VSVFGRIQRLALGGLLLILVFAGALFALPYLVPERDIRAALAHSLQAATGADPRLEGEARFTLLPRPGIRLDGVRFGGAEPSVFSAGSLAATIRLLPLLFGRVEIASLVFERPRLLVEIGDDGMRLVGLPLRLSDNSAESARPNIRIVDGIAELRGSGGRSESLSALECSLAWRGTDLAAKGSFQWRNIPVTATLLIADPNGLAGGGRSPLRLRAEAEPLRVSFEGGLAFRKGLQAEGVLAAESNSLRAALAWGGIEPPTKGGFGPFSLKAQAALTPAGLALSGLSLELDGNRAQGGLTLTREGGRPLAQGTLASETADFSPYARGFSMRGSDGRDWNAAPLDVKALAGFDLDLRLSAGRILFNKTELEHVAMAAAVRAGRFTLSVGEAQIFGGTLHGTAAIGPSAKGAEIKVEANLKDFDAERGLGELAGIRRLEGTGSLSLLLSGSGTSVSAITRDLQGRADLSVQNGSFNGLNVEQALRRLERRPLSATADLRGGRTPFDRFTAKLQVTEGNASVQEAEMQNALLRVTLSGLASIPRRDLDLRGTASLIRPAASGDGDGASFDLPFLVRGSWDDPSLAPDPAALLRHSEVSPLLHAAGFITPTVASRSTP